jgi:hypothetical protein
VSATKREVAASFTGFCWFVSSIVGLLGRILRSFLRFSRPRGHIHESGAWVSPADVTGAAVLIGPADVTSSAAAWL